jgi:hypothetical protein
MTQPLDAIPLWGLILLVVVLLSAAFDGGYRLGRWRHDRTPDEKEQPVGAMVGSILGLLALVMGFTFSLAALRFDSRRQAVLNEANAIGTTYLRSRLLLEPESSRAAALLREYVAVRIVSPGQTRPVELEAAIARAEELLRQLWDEADRAGEKSPDSEMTAMFIDSLNNIIELHAERIHVALRSRIPLVIWICLYAVTLMGMVGVGYQSGLSATRRSPAMWGLILSFAAVMLLIADLDRAQEGLLNVSQQSLRDVQAMMDAFPHSEADQ